MGVWRFIDSCNQDIQKVVFQHKYFLKFREITCSISLARKQFTSLIDFTNSVKYLLESRQGKIGERYVRVYLNYKSNFNF